jgi:hypothetical protein
MFIIHTGKVASVRTEVDAAGDMAEDSVEIPADIQAAVDAGQVEEVNRLLTSTPVELSKSLKKKLIKNAEIAAKKLAKGPAPVAPQAKGKVATADDDEKPAGARVPTVPPSVPTGASEGVIGAAEGAIVNELLAAIESFGLPSDAMATLREKETALGLAIAPQVSAMRNAAYAAGFCARA